MCGIFSILNQQKFGLDYENIKKQFILGKTRGPENSKLLNNDIYDFILGFHRLAINGYNDNDSDQPMFFNDVYLICNGEIYNWLKLYEIIKIEPHSRSDCEIIIHLYLKYGIEQTLQLLDGVFAFMLVDMRTTIPKVFIARDTYGVRPLFIKQIKYIGTQTNSYVKFLKSYDLEPTNKDNHVFLESWCFASEMKQLVDIQNPIHSEVAMKQFQPGTYTSFIWDNKHSMFFPFDPKKNEIKYVYQSFIFSKPISFINYNIQTQQQACNIIRSSLENAVQKRVENTEREIACLLSGGLDSSIICALVNKYCKKNTLHTWSIGFEGSEDIKYAELVAKHLGTIHHSIIVEESKFLEIIDYVIYTIESYDTTSVRASVGNWLISKYILENSKAKVVFNGDGSDELTGGYMYMHMAPDELEFDKECRRLLSDIHFFDVLRSDRSISSNGLEARTPFLDRSFVENYLSIPYHLRYHPKHNQCEKYLLRKAFDDTNLLPKEVLWRTKEAFSDGVSKKTRSWFSIIKEHIKKISAIPKNVPEKLYIEKMNKLMKYTHNPPKSLEDLHYRSVFEKYYKNNATIIPYFWMPKYVDASDASARTLNIYKEKTSTNIYDEFEKKVSIAEIV
jgi:asparagine synthase (glutamine-hydrolysing)